MFFSSLMVFSYAAFDSNAWESYCFLKGDEEDVNLGEGRLRGLDGGETGWDVL